MRKLLYLGALIAAMFAAPANAQVIVNPYLSIPATNQIDTVTINPYISAPGTFTTLTAGTFSTAAYSGQGIPFSVLPSGNPLVQSNFTDILTASVNAHNGYMFLSGVTGRTIYPTGLTLMVKGTASAATSEKVLCVPSGNLLATFPIATLVDSKAVTPFSSVTGSPVPGPAMAYGCQSGDGIAISNVGTNLATTTDIYVNMPYVVQ